MYGPEDSYFVGCFFFFFCVAFIYILICNYCTSKALEGYYMRLYKQMHMHGATEKYIKFLT